VPGLFPRQPRKIGLCNHVCDRRTVISRGQPPHCSETLARSRAPAGIPRGLGLSVSTQVRQRPISLSISPSPPDEGRRKGLGRKLPDILTRIASLDASQPGLARQRLGVRWVRGEGTHRFPLEVGRPSKAVSALFPTSHRTPKPRGNSDGSGAGGALIEIPLSLSLSPLAPRGERANLCGEQWSWRTWARGPGHIPHSSANSP
jgi:hypothetical protein